MILMDSVRSCERALNEAIATPLSVTRPTVNYLDKELIVGVGEYKIVSSPLELMCIGLGSCASGSSTGTSSGTSPYAP